jgi:hypothetical protein
MTSDILCSRLRKLTAPVKAAVATSDSLALLRAMSILRNTIHHVGLSHAAESDGLGKISENYVVLPASETTKFRQHAATLQKTSQWIAKDFYEYGLILRPVSLIEDLVTQSVLLFETVVSTLDWPGTIDEDLRVRSDDPVEWWMYYSPTVSLVASLYGLESDWPRGCRLPSGRRSCAPSRILCTSVCRSATGHVGPCTRLWTFRADDS